MTRDPLIMNTRLIQNIRKAMVATIVLGVALLGIYALFLLRSKLRSSDLENQVMMQRQTLADLRKATVSTDDMPVVDLKLNDVLAKLQTQLERKARSVNCTITEFQAAGDRSPYLSTFALETNRPEWEQVGVSLTLHGSLASTLATIESLRSSGTPLEPDSIEISRQSVSNQGAALVSVHLAFRVLVRAGGA